MGATRTGVAGVLALCVSTATAGAAGIIGIGVVDGRQQANRLEGGFRWDAAPRTSAGGERSLVGGLRYSVAFGSFEAYRDRFTFSNTPTVQQFQTTIEEAFDAWTQVDPATGFGTDLRFVADLATPTAFTAGALNANGAEIDLGTLASTTAGARAETFVGIQGSRTTLTSGTTNYRSTGAISGADIKMSTNATYTLDVFRLLLSHEIGHALGLADVDTVAGPAGEFLDDDYDGTTANSARDTLTNSWASLVNPLNPALSPELELYAVANGNPGTKTTGVNILMESEGLGGQFGDRTPLTNDDFGGRQFLYPWSASVPEPAALAAVLLAALPFARRRRVG